MRPKKTQVWDSHSLDWGFTSFTKSLVETSCHGGQGSVMYSAFENLYPELLIVSSPALVHFLTSEVKYPVNFTVNDEDVDCRARAISCLAKTIRVDGLVTPDRKNYMTFLFPRVGSWMNAVQLCWHSLLQYPGPLDAGS